MEPGECPACSGAAKRSVAPGYWECQSVIQETVSGLVPDQATPPWLRRMRPVAYVTERVCGQRYQTGETSAGTPKCWCGTFSIGECAQCRTPICGDHSRLAAARICVACITKEEAAQARAEAKRAAERAAEHARRESERLEREVQAKRELLERQKREHAKAVAANRVRYGPEEPVLRRLASLEARHRTLLARARPLPATSLLAVLTIGGFFMAMVLGALVCNAILGLSQEAVDRVAPVIMVGGSVVGAAIWTILYVWSSALQTARTAVADRISDEETKLGCGMCSKCRSRRSL